MGSDPGTLGPTLRNPDPSIFDSSSTPNLRRLLAGDPAPIVVTPIDTINEEDCGSWTQVGAHSATVSTIRLEVPGKARNVYQKACGDLKRKHLEVAQHEAQNAIDGYHDYPAAWVLLGQVFYNAGDLDRAQEACTQASKIDPNYVASYLCLAAISSRQLDWDTAQSFSDQALLLSPLKNPYGHYYRAEAAFQKGDLQLAERNALDAAGDDVNHQMPEIELLLARIYFAMKKSDEAAVSVRDYLKWAHQPADPAAVNAEMAVLNPAAPAAK
jgi:predicted Zn-dependent protease